MPLPSCVELVEPSLVSLVVYTLPNDLRPSDNVDGGPVDKGVSGASSVPFAPCTIEEPDGPSTEEIATVVNKWFIDACPSVDPLNRSNIEMLIFGFNQCLASHTHW